MKKQESLVATNNTVKETKKDQETSDESSDDDSNEILPPLQPLSNTEYDDSIDQKINIVTKESLNTQAIEIKKTQEKIKSFSFYKVYEFIKLQHDASYAPSPKYYTDANLVSSKYANTLFY